MEKEMVFEGMYELEGILKCLPSISMVPSNTTFSNYLNLIIKEKKDIVDNYLAKEKYDRNVLRRINILIEAANILRILYGFAINQYKLSEYQPLNVYKEYIDSCLYLLVTARKRNMREEDLFEVMNNQIHANPMDNRNTDESAYDKIALFLDQFLIDTNSKAEKEAIETDEKCKLNFFMGLEFKGYKMDRLMISNMLQRFKGYQRDIIKDDSNALLNFRNNYRSVISYCENNCIEINNSKKLF